MSTHHRRVVTRTGGDARQLITTGSYYEPTVMIVHHRRIWFEPAVINYHRWFGSNRR